MVIFEFVFEQLFQNGIADVSYLFYFFASPKKGAKTHVFEPGCGKENARKSELPARMQGALRGFSSSPQRKRIF